MNTTTEKNLNNEAVLCMYDIRGIQSYIFRTNKVKDIIGSSIIVDGILEKGIRIITKTIDNLKASLDWKDQNDFNFDNNNLDLEIIFIGGGNAYIMFKDKELSSLFNKKLSRWILDKTYSLQLAIALVKRTDNYSKDYENLQNEMRKIKNTMPLSLPIGSFAPVRIERDTGYPMSKFINNEEYSQETFLKREAYTNYLQENANQSQLDKDTKHLDNLVKEKGKDSWLAFVHIDGNSMGSKIASSMNKIKDSDYNTSVKHIREISKKITSVYIDSYNIMKEKSLIISKENKKFIIRDIILAGDDITFVCTASYAFSLVEFLLDEISKNSLFSDDKSEIDYTFTSCAGISFANSHFPFSLAYKVAEECCSNAKKRAKIEKFDKTLVGNWIDFQICTHINTTNLESYRDINYNIGDGTYLINRPYNIPIRKDDIIHLKEEFSFDNFKENISLLKDKNEIPRSWTKELRNTYPLGKHKVNELRKKLESRGNNLPEKLYDDNSTAKLYDALEILDYYEDILSILNQQEGGGISNEKI